MTFTAQIASLLDRNVEWIVFGTMIFVAVCGLLWMATRKPGKPW